MTKQEHAKGREILGKLEPKIKGDLSDFGEDVAAGRITESEAMQIEQRANAEPAPEHTPGPYHVEKSCGRYEIWPKNHSEPHTYVGIAQTKADAELLAAAPELLAALALLNAFAASAVSRNGCNQKESDLFTKFRESGGQISDLVEANRELIAKAKGQA